jgi:hypothetical protein
MFIFFYTYYFQDFQCSQGDANIDILQASHKSLDSYHGPSKLDLKEDFLMLEVIMLNCMLCKF